MIALILECVIAVVSLLSYRLLKRLRASESAFIAGWASAVWAPTIMLLVYTWLFLSLVVLPWSYYFQQVYMALNQVTTKQAVIAVSARMVTLNYYSSMFIVAGYTLLLSWLSMSVINKWEADFLKQSTLASRDLHRNIDTMFMVIRGAVYVVAGFILMKVLDLNHLADSLFTTGAVGAIFVSFAARDSIANVFGGLMILFDRPFRVGDYVSSPDRDIEGTVERIGWRVTQVRTPRKTVKYIPNCAFSTVSIENISRMSNRRIRMTVGIRYDDLKKVERICEQLEAMVDSLEFVDKRMAHFCTFSELGDYSVNLLVVVYTKPLSFKDYHKAKDSVLHNIVKIVRKNKADFPFPTTTLDAEHIVERLKNSMAD